MKTITTTIALALLISINLTAQEYKKYGEKSGKIIYQHKKYTRQARTYTNAKGETVSENKDVPYVEKEVIYYWDNYGNIEFEKAFKISEFGGKKLPEKQKMYEMVIKDGHRYYRGFEKYKFEDDNIGNRQEWKENPELLKKVGWYKAQYPEAKNTGKEKICNKEATIYNNEDWLWKGLILKNVSYYTNGKGEKSGIERSYNAIDIKIEEIDESIFNPKWLKEELHFKELDGNQIKELIEKKPKSIIEIGSEINSGDKFICKTSKGNYSKIVFTDVDKDDKRLKFIYMTYGQDNEVYSSGHNYGRPLRIGNKESLDMDNITIDNATTLDKEFEVDFSSPTIIVPLNNCKFYKLIE